MRKADYAALAAIIKTQMRDAEERANTRDEVREAEACGALHALRDLAHKFASTSSVDNVEFLKACGIVK